MCECMTFPKTVDEFMEQYKVVDTEHVYTNGAEFVPIFRMRQWFEHLSSAQPEIVRCKECKWSYDDISGRICSHGVCVDCVVSDDFYCADAERREE